MRELSLQEIQQVELGILDDYASFCEEYHLRYSLGGGTLLGAIRHKGFIPWDDDIDVMMPRPDYDRFIAGYTGYSSTYQLHAHELEDGYYGLSSKIADSRTLIHEEVSQNVSGMGVNIDVFPIDGLGDTYDAAKIAFNKTSFSRELLNAAMWKRYSRSKTHGLLLEPARLALFGLSRRVDKRRLVTDIERKNREIDFETSSFAGCVCGSYRTAEIMKTETFKTYETVDFEGRAYFAIANHDEYLTKHYGDYLQLPPEEKRQTHHTYKAFWR